MRKINEIGRNPNNDFRHVRKMKIESTDVVGGRCMQGNDGHFILLRRIEQNVLDRTYVKIMNEENE